MSSTAQFFWQRWSTACGVALLVSAIASPTLAGFKPPKNVPPPYTQSTTTGVRGCSSQSEASLTAIAPRSSVGMTTSSNPVLTWFVPDEEPFKTEIELHEYEAATSGATPKYALRHREVTQSRQGLMSWTVPDEIQLEVGKHYFWRVVLYCNPDRPSTALITSAQLERQALPDELAAVVVAEQDPLALAQAYGEAGIWYEAWQFAAEAQGPDAAELRRSMLEDLLAMEETTAAEVQAEGGAPVDDADAVVDARALRRVAQATVEQLQALLAEAF